MTEQRLFLQAGEMPAILRMIMDNQAINLGTNKVGVHSTVFIEDGAAIRKFTFDAEPYLKRAEELRKHQEGMTWGEGKIVGVVPEPVLNYINLNSKDRTEREAKSFRWLKANPRFITFTPYFEPKSASFLT